MSLRTFEIEDGGMALIQNFDCNTSESLSIRLISYEEAKETEAELSNEEYIAKHHKDFKKLVGKKVRIVLTVEK